MTHLDPHRLLVKNEFEGAALGDERRNRRLERIVDGLLDDPSASFPDAAVTDSELEGTYRLLSNENVSFERIFEPHQRRTVARAAEQQDVLIVYDTSQFTFSGERDGLGPVQHKTGVQGFFGHFALVLADERSRDPLGIIGFKSFVRDAERKGKRSHKERLLDDNRESFRWGELVHQSENQLRGQARAVHVMDREADNYELLADLLKHGYHFVIRIRGDRATTTPVEGSKAHVHVTDAMMQVPHCIERDVPLSRRVPNTPNKTRIHPPRTQRTATLRVSSETLEVLRPSYLPASAPAHLKLNVVRVYEVDVPEGEPPVQWMLVTNLDIDNPADVERIVDIYRARWTIEEFFKALKTGCSFEKRQLESMHALLNALAIFVPIAWRLLRLRTLARDAPDAPATTVLSATQLAALRAYKRVKLPPDPTAHDALMAVASLGGHLKNNGAPGWQVLGRGFEKLLWLEVGWISAMAERSDR